MTAPDPALAAALDHLTTQVNPDNVLAVHKVFKRQSEDLELDLKDFASRTKVGLCGGDPISLDASAAFGAKINQLLDVHRAHQRELATAADHLKRIAVSYGHTEDEIERSWKS